MLNSPCQIIPDILIGDKSRDRAGQRRVGNSGRQSCDIPCRVRLSIVLFKNGSWEPLHERHYMWLQDVTDIPLGCYGAMDQ
ncbi:hypothetical protein TNCV_4707381 [Trichonephila clavipes]|nr:hypothetical protein TNCV_4707381 [Trichonephila clavipes]